MAVAVVISNVDDCPAQFLQTIHYQFVNVALAKPVGLAFCYYTNDTNYTNVSVDVVWLA